VGVSAITTFTTPYMIKYSDKFSGLITKILPENWITTLQSYSAGAQSLQTEKAWKRVIKSYTAIVLINSIFAIAIILLSRKFLLPFLNRILQNSFISTLTGFIISLILIIPFLWGITIKRPDSIAYKELWTKTKYNRGPVLVLEILRLIAGFLIIGLLVDKFFSAGVALLILVPVVFIVLLVFSKQIKKFYNRLERRFLSNLGIDNSIQMNSADGDKKKE
jgi:CPA2 family monovalent cation:H+ antiporter-2